MIEILLKYLQWLCIVLFMAVSKVVKFLANADHQRYATSSIFLECMCAI